VIRAAACITGAGKSTRMRAGGKKEYASIDGFPVIAKSILTFIETGPFQSIVVTVPQGHIPEASGLIMPFLPSRSPKLEIIEGGATRQESVFKALSELAGKQIEIVLIHDAARPWVTKDLVRSVFDSTREFGACIPVTEIPDAPKQVEADGIITRHFEKNTLWGAQTPQGFDFDLILAAHTAAMAKHSLYADDAEIFSLSGHSVHTVPGQASNRKVTYAHDLEAV